MSRHTQKHKKENRGLKPKGMKRCCDCNRVKRLGLYYKTGGRKSKQYSPRCKACDKKKRKPIDDARRDAYYKETYDITLDEYNKLLDSQKDSCKICKGKSGKRLAVDHNHANGNIRGLLCQRCNGILAFYRDSVAMFQSAIAYLEADGQDVRANLGRQEVRAPDA